MTTLTTVPQRPIPGRDVNITFALTESGSTYVKVWVTSAPEGSSEKAKLDKTTSDRVLFYQGAGGSEDQLTVKLLTAGKYNLVAQEYTKGASSHGGAYADDPNSYETETAVGAEATLSISVGQRLSIRLGSRRDTAKLALYVWDDTCYATTLQDHGEVTPAIEGTTSEAAATAALSSDVVTAVDALAGQTVATIAGNPNTVMADLISKYEVHRASAVFHNAADGDNTIDASFSVSGAQAAIAGAGELLRKLDLHYRNASSADPATGTQTYHLVGVKRADYANLPIADSAGDAASASLLLADIWRSYSAHIASTTVHGTADTNNPSALPPLMTVMRYFFESLRQQNPTAPAVKQTGVVQLVQTYGASKE